MKRSTGLKVLVGGAVAGALAYGLRRWHLPDCHAIHAYLEGQGAWAPFWFVFGFVLSTFFLFPRTLLLITAGVAFGFGAGVFWTTVASMISATVSFWLSRKLLEKPVLKYVAKNRQLSRVVDSLDENEFSYILFLRLVHFSFGAISYLCGALPLRFGPYFWATLVGTTPPTVAVVYASSTMGCAVIDGAGLSPDLRWKLWGSGIALALMAAIPIVYKKIKKSGEKRKPRRQ